MTEMPNEPNQYGLEEEFGRLEGSLEAAEEEVAELRAENARLRAALQDILIIRHIETAWALAREALGLEAT